MRRLLKKIFRELQIYNVLLNYNSLFKLLKLFIFRLLKLKKILQIKYSNLFLFVRTHNLDLETIVFNIRSEYSYLSEFFAEDFDGVIVDAGGYIGGAAISLSRMYPNSQIISIEPSIDNYKILLKNTKEIGNIKAINAAIMPNNNESKAVNFFKRAGHSELGFTIVRNSSDSSTSSLNEVECVTVKSLESELGKKISLMKMDIEGAEGLFFNEEDWGGLNSIDIIFIELHERIVPGIEKGFRKTNRHIIPTDGEKFISIRKDLK